ncbi:hypothetical protein B0O99DRAFT_589266 [Bisporella sp. PMI_857]|nr:hypothetical protein B0O99DRAFT_589266 [Bisporella sp. PMI_857]
MASTASAQNSLTSAQQLMQHHNEHFPTVEDVVDEADLKHSEEPKSSSVLEAPSDESAPGWVPPMSAKAAGKRKEDAPAQGSHPNLDPASEELFPVLGGGPKPTQSTPATWGKSSGTATPTTPNDTSNGISNGASTPSIAIRQDPRKINIPGQVKEDYTLQNSQILSRKDMKKPLPDILKDINRKSKKVTVTHSSRQNDTTFTATGPSREAVREALLQVISQVGAKITDKVAIPSSTKAHIIGKAGSKIKEIQERTGARIQIPKSEGPAVPVDDEDDPIIEILIEGNALAVGNAQREILKIAGERTPSVNSKLRSVPAEFFPFIAQNERIKSFENQGAQIRVPKYHTWSRPPPEDAAELQPALGDNVISLAGERQAVQALKAEIENFVTELKQQVEIDNGLFIDRARHQFIIGKAGMTADEFLAETGCAIILPGDVDVSEITLIGPSQKIAAARKLAQSQVNNMQNGRVDVQKYSRSKEATHAQNLTQYLRQRKALEQIEAEFGTHIVPSDGATLEIFSREYSNISNATTEVHSIIRAHPPSRIATVPVDPFYHSYLQKDITPKIKSDYGVHIVVPNSSDGQVLLIYEGEDGLDPEYKVSRSAPKADEIKAFEKGLRDAQKHIIDIISAQAQITSKEIDVPQIFHDKLKRYIRGEMDAERAAGNIPVRVSSSGTIVTLRGPAPAVESLATKVNAFVKQAEQDEKERGFTLPPFDFPQKHANQLIGKQGSYINGLREKFDVDIKVEDGKVEIKGPKAKAEAARSHISALGRQWADETTHTLIIDPKYHRELIGREGNQIHKLQNKYKVQIQFPRSARPVKDDQSNGDAASESGRKGNRKDQAPNEVIIKGPKKGADDTRGELLDLVQYLQDNSFSATVSVQQSQIPSLIGQGGKLMDELRATTGARIDVPNAKDAKDSSGNVDIQIKGTKAEVAQAKKLLEEKKNIFDHTITKTLDVDKKHHRALIGGGGSKLREIVVKAGGSDDRRDLARTVQFPKSESDGNSIKIEGNKEVVDKIIALMQEIVADLDNQTTDIVEVPTDKHRTLIGRGGETKKDLESRLKVSLDIPRQGSGQTGVKITGAPSEVETAKAHILQLVKEQEGETILVPRSLHHVISDNGQFFRKLQSNLQVTVNHDRHQIPPKPAAPSASGANGASLPTIVDDDDTIANSFSWHVIGTADSGLDGEIPWILRGSPENVAKAKANLATAIEQASNSSRGFLRLPDPSTYRFVIGQGGSKVNSIRKATGCKITVPRDQAKDEAIEISGSLDGIEKAKDLILEAVKDGKNNTNGRA